MPGLFTHGRVAAAGAVVALAAGAGVTPGWATALDRVDVRAAAGVSRLAVTQW